MLQLMGIADEESYKGAWLDIYVDFQGPFPESVEGLRYFCTYTCRLLRVPMLVPCDSAEGGRDARRWYGHAQDSGDPLDHPS